MLATESTKHDDEDILDDSQKELTVDKAIELYKPDFVPNQRIADSENLKKYALYAAILGDISGSAYEGVRLPINETYETIDMFTEMAARKPPKLACAEELPINIKYFLIDFAFAPHLR